MKEDPFIQTLQEDIRRAAERPLEELHRDLMEEGIMDEKGKIIVRPPQPPGVSERGKKSHKRNH